MCHFFHSQGANNFEDDPTGVTYTPGNDSLPRRKYPSGSFRFNPHVDANSLANHLSRDHQRDTAMEVKGRVSHPVLHRAMPVRRQRPKLVLDQRFHFAFRSHRHRGSPLGVYRR